MVKGMRRIVFVAGALFLLWGGLCASRCCASAGDVGTSSAQFLKLGLGARAVAMGGAFVGLADDVTAIHWNPAGLAGTSGTELCFMHQSLFQDISYEYLACAQPIAGRGVLGAGVAYLHMGELKGRDELGEPTSEFGASDVAVTLSYAIEPTGNVLLGGSIKYISEKIENEQADAFAADFGWLYRTPMGKVYLGGAIQNVGQEVRFVSESYGLPRLFKFGATYVDSLAGNPFGLMMDFYMPSDNRSSVHFGTEYIYRNVIAARAGYGGGSDLGSGSNFSFGLGVIVTGSPTYRLDYAFVPRGDLGSTHTISLSLQFGH